MSDINSGYYCPICSDEVEAYTWVPVDRAEYESLQADSRKLAAVRMELEGMIGEQEGNTFYYEDKFGKDIARVKYPAPFFMLEELRSLMAILEGNDND